MRLEGCLCGYERVHQRQENQACRAAKNSADDDDSRLKRENAADQPIDDARPRRGCHSKAAGDADVQRFVSHRASCR
jgi:hypothetical protein